MKDFAKEFYLSKEWRAVRAYIFERDLGICTRCGAPGEIVHHKKELTPENINNPYIALGEDNLTTLCRDCHSEIHNANSPTGAGLMFDAEGNLVQRTTVQPQTDKR